MFFRLVTNVGQRKILSPCEEWNLRPLDSTLRCSSTEPQRLLGERGLLRSSNDTCPAHCQDQQCRQRNVFERKVEMVSFQLGEELRKMFFRKKDEKTSFLILHRAQNLPSLLFTSIVIRIQKKFFSTKNYKNREMKKETEDSHNQKLKLTENRSLFLRDKSIQQLSVL